MCERVRSFEAGETLPATLLKSGASWRSSEETLDSFFLSLSPPPSFVIQDQGTQEEEEMEANFRPKTLAHFSIRGFYTSCLYANRWVFSREAS